MEERALLAAIVPGQTLPGTLSSPGQQVSYTFSASVGNTFQFSMGSADASPDGVRPELTLFDPSGAEVRHATAMYTANTSTSVSYTVPAGKSGNYTVVAEDSGNYDSGIYFHTGGFFVELALAPAASNASTDADGDGGLIFSGELHTASVQRHGNIDVYALDAAAGNTFEVSMGTNSSSDLRPHLTLIDPTGAVVRTANAMYSTDYAVSVYYTVPAGKAGRYTIFAQDTGYSIGHTGSYHLELALAPSGANAFADSDGDGGTLASGQTRFADIDRLGNVDVYTFDAAVGSTFDVSMGTSASSGARPHLTLLDPSGGEVTHGNAMYETNTAVDVYYTVPAGKGGTYTVFAQDAGYYPGPDTGSYHIELAYAPAVLDAAPDSDGDGGRIHSGKLTPGSIDRTGDLDIFTFWAAANDSFAVTMSTAGMNNDVTPEVLVYNPLGTLVASSYAGYDTDTTITASYNTPAGGGGVYTVLVADSGHNGRSVGDYTVRLTGNLLLTAAKLSRDVYEHAPDRVGDTVELFTPLESDFNFFDLGYRAEAYRDSGDNQILIAFEGTKFSVKSLLDVPNLAGDIVANAAFISGVATSALIQQVTSAARFVERIQDSYPGRTIVLTGHSLGGSIAQVVGKALKLKTLAFSSPGTYYLYPELSEAIAGIGTVSNSLTNINVRIYGDPFSVLGTPLATQYTLVEPPTPPSSSPSNPIELAVRRGVYYYTVHSIDTVVSQIQNNAPLKPSTPEPFDVTVIQGLIVATRHVTGPLAEQFSHAYSVVTSAAERLFEALPGKRFTFAGDASSPLMNSIMLPEALGVASYSVRYLVGSSWSAPQAVAPGTRFLPATPTRSFDFMPLDSSGQEVRITGPFLFAARFASAGTFNGTLTGDPSFAIPSWLTLGPDAEASFAGDTFELAYGTATLAADLGATFPGMAVEVSGNATLTFNTSQTIGPLRVEDGASVRLAAGGGQRTLVVGSLSVATGATLDLADHAMVVRSGGVAAVQPLIAAGFNQGNWNGAGGIVSSSAAADASRRTALGFASNANLNKSSFAGVAGLTAGDVLVKYTYAGDANLDGQVDIGDLGLLAGAWQQLSGKGWFDGDFTYDGAVNIGDLGLLAGNWQKGVGNPI